MGRRTLWAELVMLFFSSFFPLTTNMVAANFWNSTAQVAYGIIILCVTAANVVLYRMLARDNAHIEGISPSILGDGGRMGADIAIKCVGIVLSAMVFAPAMSVAVAVTLLFLVIPPQPRE